MLLMRSLMLLMTMLLTSVPLIFGQVDSVICDFNAFCGKELRLHPCAAKSECAGEFSLCIHDTETGNPVGIGVFVQRVTDGARHFLSPASSATCE